MAVAFVRKFGGNARTTSGTTVVITPLANAAAGDFLVCVAASGGGQDVSTITDTKSNTWTQAANAGNVSSSVKVWWTHQDGGALTTGDTVTVTFASALSNATALISEFSGVVATPPTDTSGVATSTTSTSLTVTSSGSITNGNDLLIGAHAWQAASNQTCTAGAGYAGDEQDQGGGGFLDVFLEYQILSGASLTTQTATATLSGAPTNASSAIVAFIPSAVVGDVSWIQPPNRSPSARFAAKRGLALMRATETNAWRPSLIVGGTSSSLYPITLSDTGLSQSDALVSGRTRVYADTGLAQSDALVTGRLHTRTDTGLTQSDALASLRRCALTDNGLTPVGQLTSLTLQTTTSLMTEDGSLVDAVTTVRLHNITDTGLAQSDSIQLAGSAHFTRNLTDTGLTETDTLVSGRLRALADAGVSQSDTTVSGRLRSLTDTGLAQSDSLVRTHVIPRVLTDTGVSQSDTQVTGRLRALTDTGLAQSDSLAVGGSHLFTINLSDTGVTQTDALVSGRARSQTDTGLTQSDSVTTRHVYARPFADTGLTQSDAVATQRLRIQLDTGLAQADSIGMLVRRAVTTTGLAQSDSLVTAKTLPRLLSDTGLTQTDALLSLRGRSLTDQAVAFNDVLVAITSGTTIITASFNTHTHGQTANTARESVFAGAGHGQPYSNPHEGRFN